MDGGSPFPRGCRLPCLPKLRTLRFEGRPDAVILDWVAGGLSPNLRTVHLWVPGNEFDKTMHCLDRLAALPRHVALHLCCDGVEVPFARLRHLSGLVSLQCRYIQVVLEYAVVTSKHDVVTCQNHAIHPHSHTSMCAIDVVHLTSLPALHSLQLHGYVWENVLLFHAADRTHQ